jgi:hypothetical protein
MTIQPLSSPRREISVTEIIEPAYDRVKRMLFKPFDFTKWIVIGFCAWLAGLGESGGGGSFGGNHGFNNQNNNAQPAEQFRHFYHQASDYVLANLGWLIPVVIFVVLVLLAIWLLVLWLSSRGKFMFLHCVVEDKAEVEAPWHKFAGAANSLFRFRLAVCLAGMVLMLPLLVFMAVDIIRMVLQGEPDLGGVMLAVGLGLALFFVSIVFALIHKFTVDFVVPIMFLRNGTCAAAWREFWGLLAANPGQFALYILFQIVLGLAIGVIVLLAIVVTCCIACCLMMLPFVGTVLLLPVLIFKRAYPLYYLAQYGPQYDVFPQPAASPMGSAQAPPPMGV